MSSTQKKLFQKSLKKFLTNRKAYDNIYELSARENSEDLENQRLNSM